MKKKYTAILLLILSLNIYGGCKSNNKKQCKSVKNTELEILRNERKKFNQNIKLINNLKDNFVLNKNDSKLQNLKNPINCEEIKKSENNEIVFYFKNSFYESCAIGGISFVYVYSKNDYRNTNSNLIKYYRLNKDYILKIYLPDF